MSAPNDLRDLTPMSRATMIWLNSQYNDKRRKELKEKRDAYIRVNVHLIYKNAVQLAENSGLTRITYLVTDAMTKIAYDIILELRRLFTDCEVSCIRITSSQSTNYITEIMIDDDTIQRGNLYNVGGLAPVYIVVDWS